MSRHNYTKFEVKYKNHVVQCYWWFLQNFFEEIQLHKIKGFLILLQKFFIIIFFILSELKRFFFCNCTRNRIILYSRLLKKPAVGQKVPNTVVMTCFMHRGFNSVENKIKRVFQRGAAPLARRKAPYFFLLLSKLPVNPENLHQYRRVLIFYSHSN